MQRLAIPEEAANYLNAAKDDARVPWRARSIRLLIAPEELPNLE